MGSAKHVRFMEPVLNAGPDTHDFPARQVQPSAATHAQDMQIQSADSETTQVLTVMQSVFDEQQAGIKSAAMETRQMSGMICDYEARLERNRLSMEEQNEIMGNLLMRIERL